MNYVGYFYSLVRKHAECFVCCNVVKVINFIDGNPRNHESKNILPCCDRCDVIIKRRVKASGIVYTKSYWKSLKEINKNNPNFMKFCQNCGLDIRNERSNKIFCSARCKKEKWCRDEKAIIRESNT